MNIDLYLYIGACIYMLLNKTRRKSEKNIYMYIYRGIYISRWYKPIENQNVN